MPCSTIGRRRCSAARKMPPTMFSTFIMLQFDKPDARRLILGNAYQYKGDIRSPVVVQSMRKFSDVHGTPSQRYYNVLCLAYGADPVLFGDFVTSGKLPKDRAEGCEFEYQQVANAFERLVVPNLDQDCQEGLARDTGCRRSIRSRCGAPTKLAGAGCCERIERPRPSCITAGALRAGIALSLKGRGHGKGHRSRGHVVTPATSLPPSARNTTPPLLLTQAASPSSSR